MNRVTVYTGIAGQLTSVSTGAAGEPVHAPRVSEPLDLSTGRFLNESAIREHSLRCATTFRGGRFTRVGQDFLDEVSADVEAMIRELRNKYPTQIHEPLEPAENMSCVTGALCDKFRTELNRAICRLLQNKVQRQPTVGKTLGRTR